MGLKELLKAEGLHLKQEGIKKILLDLEISEENVKVEDVMKHILDIDLKEIGDKCLPDIKAGAKVTIKEPMILQVVESKDISQPDSKQDFIDQSDHRLTRLKLTDGNSVCRALEYKRIPQISNISPGIKVMIQNVSSQGGYFLLYPENIKILGGRVEELVMAWEATKLRGRGRATIEREESEEGPPKFLPTPKSTSQKINLETDNKAKSQPFNDNSSAEKGKNKFDKGNKTKEDKKGKGKNPRDYYSNNNNNNNASQPSGSNTKRNSWEREEKSKPVQPSSNTPFSSTQLSTQNLTPISAQTPNQTQSAQNQTSNKPSTQTQTQTQTQTIQQPSFSAQTQQTTAFADTKTNQNQTQAPSQAQPTQQTQPYNRHHDRYDRGGKDRGRGSSREQRFYTQQPQQTTQTAAQPQPQPQTQITQQTPSQPSIQLLQSQSSSSQVQTPTPITTQTQTSQAPSLSTLSIQDQTQVQLTQEQRQSSYGRSRGYKQQTTKPYSSRQYSNNNNNNNSNNNNSYNNYNNNTAYSSISVSGDQSSSYNTQQQSSEILVSFPRPPPINSTKYVFATIIETNIIQYQGIYNLQLTLEDYLKTSLQVVVDDYCTPYLTGFDLKTIKASTPLYFQQLVESLNLRLVSLTGTFQIEYLRQGILPVIRYADFTKQYPPT